MDQQTAVDLIKDGIQENPQHWADLGCGDGTFTKALASLLVEGSSITAVDKDSKSVSSISDIISQIPITRHVADIEQFDQYFSAKLEGVILANVLHYFPMKATLTESIRSRLLNPGGKLIIIEYDTDMGNPWVPFPIPMKQLIECLESRGWVTQEIGRADSKYQKGGLYSLLATDSTSRST